MPLRAVFYRAPLLAPCCALIGGLLAGRGDILPSLLFSSVSCLGCIVAFGKKGVAYILLAVSAFTLGSLWSYRLGHPSFPPLHIALLPLDRVREIEAEVVKATDPRDRYTAMVLETKRVRLTRWIRAEGLLRLFCRGQVHLEPGTVIRARVRLRRPRNFSNPGGFDYRWYLARQGIFVTGRVVGKVEIVREEKGIFGRVRERFRKCLLEYSTERARGILKALTLGQRGEILPQVEELLRQTGTSHLLAISGLHIGTVSAFFVLLFRALFKRVGLKGANLWSALSALPFAWAYVFFAQSPVSAVRAALMAASFALVVFLGRPKGVLNILCLSALLILAISPGSLWSPSFQLSFMAVLGISVLTPRILPPLSRDLRWPLKGSLSRRILRFALLTLALSLSAQIATAPILLGNFHLLSLVGPVANLVAVPAVAFLALPLGLISIPLSLLSSPLSAPFIMAASVILELLLRVLEVLARIPFSHLWLPGPTLFEGLLFYALVILGFYLREVPKRLAVAGDPLPHRRRYHLLVCQDQTPGEAPDHLPRCGTGRQHPAVAPFGRKGAR